MASANLLPFNRSSKTPQTATVSRFAAVSFLLQSPLVPISNDNRSGPRQLGECNTNDLSQSRPPKMGERRCERIGNQQGDLEADKQYWTAMDVHCFQCY